MSFALQQANRVFGGTRNHDIHINNTEVDHTGTTEIVAVTYPQSGDFTKAVATNSVLIDLHAAVYINRSNVSAAFVGFNWRFEYSQDSGSSWTDAGVSGTAGSESCQGSDGVSVSAIHASFVHIVKLLTGLTSTTLRVRLKVWGTHNAPYGSRIVLPVFWTIGSDEAGDDGINRIGSVCKFHEITT